MSFADKLRSFVGWTDTPDSTFVDEQSERLVELVFSNARAAVETAREAHVPRPEEAEIIGALIDKLQDAGY